VKKLILLAVLLAVAALPLAGCVTDTTIEAALGETFDVPIHQDAVLPAENLRLTFQEVREDSRCPRSVECVTAGQAVYTIRFTQGSVGAAVTFVELGGGGQAEASFLDYVVSANLQPYPEQPGDIPPEDYAVRLTITRPPLADALPEDDMAAVYTAVIHQLLTADNNAGGPLDLTNLYLVYVTRDDTPIDPTATPDPHLLAATLRDKIAARLADLVTDIHWVAGMDAVSLEGTGTTVAGGGAFVSLGNIKDDGSGTFQVYAGLYVANLNGTGRVYLVSRVDGEWQVTGHTGVVWMS
jgi:hypothetical protein